MPRWRSRCSLPLNERVLPRETAQAISQEVTFQNPGKALTLLFDFAMRSEPLRKLKAPWAGMTHVGCRGAKRTCQLERARAANGPLGDLQARAVTELCLQESQQVGIDRVGLRRRHAVRE